MAYHESLWESGLQEFVGDEASKQVSLLEVAFMKQSELIRHGYTEHMNKNELHYREIIQPKEDDISKWINKINDGRRDIFKLLCRFIEFKGEILELGSGSCWFGSELSRIDSVKKIYCHDMSEFILNEIAPHIMVRIGAHSNKIVRVIGDFNKLDFEDGKFNYVVFDASLHHIPENSYYRVLREVYRVLKISGKVVAIREPFMNSMSINKKNIRETKGLHEKKYGVTENIFTKKEWKNIFVKCGFIPNFIPLMFHVKSKSSIRNIMKNVVRYSPLRIAFLWLSRGHIIVLEKRCN